MCAGFLRIIFLRFFTEKIPIGPPLNQMVGEGEISAEKNNLKNWLGI